MPRLKCFLLFATLLISQALGLAYSAVYLKPGDVGEFVFTVVNSSDSAGFLGNPQVVYENRPWWFSMGGLSILSHDPLAPDTSCELLVDYAIDQNAPTGIADLDFKVIFTNPNVYPPVWHPAQGTKVIVDGTRPTLAVYQPAWFGYNASTTVFSGYGATKIIKGPSAGFYATDPESGISDFQIYNSSEVNLAAEYFREMSGGVGYSGSFPEDIYNVTTLNNAGNSTTAKIYIDHTPQVSVLSYDSEEISGGNFLDTFVLSASSRWGIGQVKLLPASFTVPDPMDASGFDAASAIREYDAGGLAYSTFTFTAVPVGEYVVYVKNMFGTLSSFPVSIHSETTLNPETGEYAHTVQYLNPDSLPNDGNSVSLNFDNGEKLDLQFAYAATISSGITFAGSSAVSLPQEIVASHFTFPYGLGFIPKTTTVFSGDVSVRVDYRQSPFTQYQMDNARLYAFVDSVWVNVTNDVGPGWVMASMPVLAKMALVFPYPSVQLSVAKTETAVGDQPEGEFSSYLAGVSLAAAPTDQAPISAYLAAEEAKGRYLVSNMLTFDGAGAELVPPGTLIFRYPASQLSKLGVNETALGLSCIFADSLTGVATSKEGESLVALLSKVPQFCGIFSADKPVVPDMIAPESSLDFEGLVYTDSAGKQYLGVQSNVSLSSQDSAQDGVTASGVKTLYYAADVAADFMARVSAGDFSDFSVYLSTFNVLEGSHTITYFAVDGAGNMESPNTSVVNADYSSPETSNIPTDGQMLSDEVLYSAAWAPFVLSSVDPEYEGIAAGTRATHLLVDISRADCPADPIPDGNQFGTCANSVYDEAFRMTPGAHSVYYWSEDNVGNIEDENSQVVFIDTVTPVTTLYVNGEILGEALSEIPQESTIRMTAADPLGAGDASGIRLIGLLIDTALDTCVSSPTFTGPQGTCDNPAYNSEFTLSPGTHTILYFSCDNVDNCEAARTLNTAAIGDITPPETNLYLGDINVSTYSVIYASASGVFSIAAEDPVVDGQSSGVRGIYYLIDVSEESCGEMGPIISTAPAGSCQNYRYDGPFGLSVGSHIVYYTAEDNVGNTAEIKSASIEIKGELSVNFYSSDKTATSILWKWDLVEGATAYQVVSSTGDGEALSGVLAATATVYAQAGLMPNTPYTASLLAYTLGGIQKSDVVSAVTLAKVPMSAESFLSGQNASVVLGQQSFYDRNYGSGPGQLAFPRGLAMDGVGNLWVVDTDNHRVLRYSPPFITGKSADLVIGQTSLYFGFYPAYVAADNLQSPRSIAFDRNGRLWVTDGRKRVLRFSPPFITGMSADLVIGADNFTSMPSGTAAPNRFCTGGPYIGSDASGSVWVSDGGCHRVLRFSPPFSNGMSANLVLGQPDYSSSAGTTPPNERAFYYPAGIGFDLDDNIWVADIGNSRVLKFEQPYVNGKEASLVIGQPDFFTKSTYWISASRNKLVEPAGVDFDGQGNLYVAESGPPRVLQFCPTFLNGMDASVVIGQPNFTSLDSGVGPASFGGDGLSLEASGFVYTDPHGRIWVADRSNHRVLLFEPGGNRSFNAVGSSSFTLQWDSAFNSPQTVYLAEISQTPYFTYGVTASGEITSVSHAFTGLEGGVRYYARVRAKNLDGIYTEYLNLGSIQLKPAPPGDVSGAAASPTSIVWSWTPAPSGTYELFSSTGGIVSGVLAAGTSWYLQTGLTPNTTYSCFVRITNESGTADSPVVSVITSAAPPDLPQFLTSGQAADFVLGQTNFISAVSGRTASAVGWISHVARDKSGNLWVTDESNCRVLRFDPPFSAGMSASLVIGPPDFTSSGCFAARNRLSRPRAATVDSEGRLWVSDAGANRVLMFNPPFSNGMDADLVIGQADFASYVRSSEPYGLTPAGLVVDKEGSLWVADSFNSRVLQFSPPFYNGMPQAGSVGYYSATPNSGSLRNPEGVAIDPEGNLWVVDTGNNRVMEFVPPFSAGMPSSVIIGRFTGYVRPDTMATPRGLAFDSEGNLYVADGYARVLAYKKPFSMYMNASVALGQTDLYSFVRGLSAVLMTASPYGVTAGGDGRVWVADRNNRRTLGFKRSPFTDIAQSSLMASWDVGANPSGTLYRLELSSSTDYADAVITEWAENSSAAISGLLPATTYYARVRAKNLAGFASEPLDLGVVETLPVPPVYSRSAALVGGKPEVSLASLSQMSVEPVDSGTPGAQVAIGSAVLQGLITASPIYNIGPEGTYAPPAMMSFYYSSSAVAAIGVPESELAVYEYFAGTGWVRLDGQVLDTFNKKISVPLTHIASLFGMFIKAEDWAPPITEFVVTGSSYAAAADLYIGTGSAISFNASDPVVFGTSFGVAFTQFRVDGSSSVPFTAYSEPIVLSTGAHRLEFRSGDNAGNIEDIRFLEVIVDGEGPAVSYAIAGSSFPVEGRLYAAPGSTVALAATDAGAGIKALAYEFNGSTYSEAAGSAAIHLSEGGENHIRYSAEDNVGNAVEPGEILVWVDTAAPSSLLQLNGSPETADWYTSSVVAAIVVTDAGSGVQQTVYSLDGSSFAVYAATFTVLIEGKHSLEFYSKDNVLNTEKIQQASFGIDLSTPIVGYAYTPESNGEGWNNTPVNVVFAGTDVISGVAYCSSSFTVSGEGAGIPISGYCADYAGWTSSAAFSLNIDTTAPVSAAEISAQAGLAGWLVSPAVVALSAADNLSGLEGIYYTIDGSSAVLYSSTFTVAGEGGHILRYYGVDKAGNREEEKILEFKLDLAAPSVIAVSSPSANTLGWNNMSVTVAFSGTDAVSGLAYCDSEKLVAIEGSSQPVSGYCMDHAGWSSTATVAVSIDTTAPSLVYSAAPSANEAGWNNTDVILKFSCEDALSGMKTCPADIVLASEGAAIAISTSAQDKADNLSMITVSGIRVDKTAPGSTADISGLLSNGWYSSAVGIVIASSDALSGVKSISYSLDGGEFQIYVSPLEVSAEGAHTLKYYAVDNAGNAEPEKTIEVRIDSSVPEITFSQTPAPNAVGWNNTTVQVVFSGSDTLSGVMECSSATVVLEGATQSVAGWCRDVAGNIAYSTATISVDLTAPDVSSVVQPLPNAHGWHNVPVEVTFTGTDLLSGIGSCTPKQALSREGHEMAVSGDCLDNAGNSSTVTVSVSIDTTAPSVSYIASPTANEAGWNNSDVTLKFSCEDALSGIESCPADIVLAFEGADISTAAASRDYAGNIGPVEVAGIKIDKTAPVTSAELAGSLVSGWHNTPVTLSLNATDALSGPAGIKYRVEGPGYSGEELVYNAPVVFEANGLFSVHFYSLDKAGNKEAEKSVSFKIDREFPAVSYSLNPAANSDGWNNGAVQVVFSGVDNFSGIKECSSATVSTEGAGQKVVGHCSDNAGNVSNATATVNIDLTPAEITITSPLEGQTYIATRGKIGVDFGVQDNLDADPAVGAFLVQIEDKGSPRGNRPARIAVTNGQSIEPLDIDDGLWKLTVSATDFADNAASADGGVFEVIHDVLAPRSTIESSGPIYSGSGTKYLTSATLFTLSSIDDLVAAGDGIGLGVKSQSVGLKAGEQTLKELSFLNPLPKQGETFVSTFGFSSLGTLADGLYNLSYSAEDILANAEPAKSLPFALDNTPPHTGLSVAGVSYEAQDRVFITGASGLVLAGVDVSSGGVSSGLLLTKYKLDGASWQVYAGSFSITTEGLHTLAYYSLDNVQNTEAERTRSIVVDNTPPVASIALGAPVFEAFGLRVITPETLLTIAASDPGQEGLASGLKSIHYELIAPDGHSSGVLNYTEPFRISGHGTYLIRCWAADNVGNVGVPVEMRVSVTGLQNDALVASGSLGMTGSADISGRVEAGLAELNGNARIMGDVYASTITLKGKGEITGLQAPLPAGFTAEPLDMAYIVARASAVNDNSFVPAGFIRDGKLTVAANAELTLTTGTYFFTGIDLSGGSKVRINGKVDMLVTGDVFISGGSYLNADGPSSGLNVFVSTRSELTFTGGGNLAAYVYAPYAKLKLTGNALLGGHYFVASADISGTGNIIQAGESLPQTTTTTGDSGSKKRASALAVSADAYSVLSGPDGSFRLGEVYVFPNPALRGAAPTLHIEVGIADRVKITFFTVSGRHAHETTLTGMPVALDDGNGLSYAYEYTWRESIPSGVYYYSIVAEKGGQKIRKAGKFGVVR